MTDHERKHQIALLNALEHSYEKHPDRTEQEHEKYAENHLQDHWPSDEEFRAIMSMPPPPPWFKLAFNVATLEGLRNEQERLQRKKSPSRQDVANMAGVDQNITWIQDQCRRITRELLDGKSGGFPPR